MGNGGRGLDLCGTVADARLPGHLRCLPNEIEREVGREVEKVRWAGSARRCDRPVNMQTAFSGLTMAH
jgi:hypothetical protein